MLLADYLFERRTVVSWEGTRSRPRPAHGGSGPVYTSAVPLAGCLGTSPPTVRWTPWNTTGSNTSRKRDCGVRQSGGWRPFAGPYGFGVYLTIDLTDEMMSVACEVRELARSRDRNAAEPVRRARDSAVQLVAADVPTSALYYADEKTDDTTWALNWRGARRGFTRLKALALIEGLKPS